MDIVSNSRISEAEYAMWRNGRKDTKVERLTVSECNARRVRMNKIVQGHKVCDDVLCRAVLHLSTLRSEILFYTVTAIVLYCAAVLCYAVLCCTSRY